MLKQRIITAIALILFVGGPVLLLPPTGFAVLAVAVFLLASWEWSRLCGWNTVAARFAYVVLVALVLAASLTALELLEAPARQAIQSTFLVSGVWWAIALLWIQSYPASASLWQSSWARALIGLLVLVPSCLAFIWLRITGPYIWLVLYLVALVAAADIGAYFFGKALGEKKMVPRVSPGKSWAGLFGGLFCSILLAAGTAYFFSIPLAMTQWLMISALVALSSVVGDLLESMLKRQCGVKDSSNILPGHGGVLDRLDGWTAAAPVFALCLLSVGWSL
ncbi:MAG: phosphatidate cytidylyltransferase [Pseudomonadales bacterium]